MSELTIQFVDKIDVEIIRVLHTTHDCLDPKPIKRTGNNMPDVGIIEDRLLDLKSQELVEIKRNDCYRLTSKGKHLFWKNQDLDGNILRLLKVDPYDNTEIDKIIGRPTKEIEDATRHLMLRNLIDVAEVKQKEPELILWKISHQGIIYLKQEVETSKDPNVQAKLDRIEDGIKKGKKIERKRWIIGIAITAVIGIMLAIFL